MKKILSFALTAIMLVSMVPTAFATTAHTNGTQVTYTATGTESYTVTVPAQLAPGNGGDVVAQGTWASNRKLVVTADADVTLTNSINAADTKTLDVTFPGIGLVGSNTAAVTDTKEVSVAAMPADALFGTWSGKFNYNVEMVDAVKMISFTIGGTEFQAEEGMTWIEWCDSEYNPGWYWVDSDYNYDDDDVYQGIGSKVKWIQDVSCHDTISNGHSYVIDGMPEDEF